MGYSGQKCEYSTVTIPSYLSEMFQTSNIKELSNILKVIYRLIGTILNLNYFLFKIGKLNLLLYNSSAPG